MKTLLPRWLFACALTAGPVTAEQLSIRLTGQAQPDSWSVANIVEGLIRPGMTDREKALAIHRFGMAHLIHFNGPVEEREDYITDPLKLIGVYGYALCGNNSAGMTALYNAAGLKTRTRNMPEHSVPEVWFENKWNYIDTDMFGYVPLPNGGIASVDELVKDPDLFVRQTKPPDPYYPFDRKEDMASVFRNVRPDHNYHPYPNAHIMNLGLRTGESATLYYRPQGRFLLTTFSLADLGTVYKDYWTLGPVRRGSLAWTDKPPAAYGNGLIQYQPDLRSEAFRRENPEVSGVAAGDDGQPASIAGAPNQTASIVLEMSSPWAIAGLQNDLTDFEDDSDGAVVSGLFWRRDPADENRIFVSADAGRTWKKVWENRILGAVPFQVDVTRYAKGRYRYWVKFEWVDRKGTGKVGLEGLSLKTWVALSPMALPRVVTGKNTFSLATAPRRTWYHESRWDRNEPLLDQRLTNMEAGPKAPYLRPSKPGAGMLDFALGPEAAADEVRFSALVRRLGSGAKVAMALSLSEDGGATWSELERFAPHPEHDRSHMWFNHVIRGRTIKGGAARLRVSLEGGGLEKVIANSVVHEPPRSPGMLRVTHAWREGERSVTATRLFSQTPARYEVEAGGDLANEWLRFEAVKPE